MKLLVFYLAGAFLHFVFIIWYSRKELTKKGFTNEMGDKLSLTAFLLMDTAISLFFWPLLVGMYLIWWIVKSALMKRRKHDLGNS